METIYPNCKFCSKIPILLLATNTVNCFPWYDRLTLFIFKKTSAKYQNRNNHGLSVSYLFQAKTLCSMNKRLINNSKDHIGIFLETAIIVHMQHESLYMLPTWLQKIILKCVPKGRYYKYNPSLYIYSSTPMESTNQGLKILEKHFSRKFQKAKLEYAVQQQLFT